MNEDLIKPDTNKPIVPDMDSDIPSITPETESATKTAKEVVPASAAEPMQTLAPAPAPTPLKAPVHDEPLLTAGPLPPASPATSEQKAGKPWARIVLIIVVALVLLAGAVYAAFAIGFDKGHTAGRKDQVAASETTAIKVPSHATMVAQCTAGAGTQYVMPTDIPQGPIYNVWNSKVTGIEFMLAQSKIANNKTLDLALKSQKYDHIDVMYEAAGHAGFTEPHYHLVLSMISYADEQKITCDSDSGSSGDSGKSHESHDMSSMDM